MPREGDPADEFVRFKAKIQRGDGPDQRGEVTVETVRELPVDSPGHRADVDVLLPDGEVLTVEDIEVQSGPFAEWYFEMQRAELALRETLGLIEDDDVDDGDD